MRCNATERITPRQHAYEVNSWPQRRLPVAHGEKGALDFLQLTPYSAPHDGLSASRPPRMERPEEGRRSTGEDQAGSALPRDGRLPIEHAGGEDDDGVDR